MAYNSSLNDPSSEEYIQLAGKVNDEVRFELELFLKDRLV